MKNTIVILFVMIFAVTGGSLIAQFNIIKKAEKTAGKEVSKSVNKSINSSSKMDTPETAESGNKNSTGNQQDDQKLKLWSKYNFVPGDKVIFQDDLASEESGEFPSRWDLISGNAENASLGSENIINLVSNNTFINPLMDKEEYLPEIFTIEFDAYFDELASKRSQNYKVRFWTTSKNRIKDSQGKVISAINFSWNRTIMGKFSSTINSDSKARKNWQPKWKHIAIAFNKRSLKVFFDEKRMLNIPNLKFKPKMFSIGCNIDGRYIKITAIKNIRVAEGGKKIYDRISSEGKFVTTGILFDVNKAVIKPESMGIINKIKKIMDEHTELKFSVEGHTDSDGDEVFNQKLSEDRAEAVKTALVSLGIDESRLKTKGYGESKPVADNSNPEGKANNRRVEFIKL